jgi:phosphoribulokinase
MPEKVMAMRRARGATEARTRRPVMLAIAGDSASGKTTLTAGLVEALRHLRVTAVCADDYHRYDREERRHLPFTPLHPDCNHIDIMEQHLQLLATGQPILKPVYNHRTGSFGRPELIEPSDIVIVEGLLPIYTKLARACFDVTVYMDPPEDIRQGWKIDRDCRKRGYSVGQVLAELTRREPESAQYIRPQRTHADVVVQFAPLHHGANGANGHTHPGRPATGGNDHPLSATLLLRPTIRHPDLSTVLTDDNRRAIHLKLVRDEDGKPVDALHVHGHAPKEHSTEVERHIWKLLGEDDPVPLSLGQLDTGARSEPLALTQLVLLYHLLRLIQDGEA